MPISSLKVLEFNELLKSQGKAPLIDNLSKRELENPEGCGIDLRVGEVYALEGKGFLGVEERKTSEAIKIADIKEKGEITITLPPNGYFLVKTIETIHSPGEKLEIEKGVWKYLMPVVYPRSTLQNCGVGFLATKTDPGYIGQLRFGIINNRNEPFEFQLGARMFNVVFEPVTGEIKRTYEGQWQGGTRASTAGTEKQI
ncbi:MAG TPA: hypothetical protein VMC07_00795 [Candidatus Omnitrophota bacterium]|nr:hypothetical protein [Candidatus Omnitrophota bacterium]